MAGSPTPTSLYDHPRYYDLVFGSDWQAEYAFLRKVFKLHAERPVVRMVADCDGNQIENGPEVDLAEKSDDGEYRVSIVQLVDNAAYQFDTSRYFV